MPKFTYSGETTDGQSVRESVTAADRYAVYDIARQNGHIVYEIEDASSGGLKKWLDMERINYHLSRVKTDELVMVTRNLANMLKAGLALSRALSVIERQSSNPRLIGIIKSVREQISQGDELHTALAKYPKTFNDLYVAMVAAGEESGGLADSLETLSQQLQRSSELKKKVKGAMIYPAIVITAMVIIGILMMIYVVPSITNTFRSLELDLPATTEFLIAFSEFMNQYTLVAIGGLLGAVVGVVYFLKTPVGHRMASWTVIRLPVIGTIAKETNSAYTARTLASLLHAGVDVVRSIDITKQVLQNDYYKEVMDTAAKRVEKGTALSETFIERDDLYPILVGEMISVGEETGQIADMLHQLAEFYENEVEQKTKDLSTIIEPILMLVIGTGVGFFALAMIAPIYSISEGLM